MRRAGLVSGVALVLLAVARPSHALDPRRSIAQYTHRAWLTEHGLPQRSAQAILQTRDGYLWLGTQEGLARFDGVSFTVFDKGTTPAIRNNNIVALWEGRDGSLWIGTGGGGLVRMKDGRFTAYGAEQGLSSGALWSVVEAHDGTVWIGTAGGGLDRLQDGRITALTTRDGLPSDNILALLEDKAGDLWIGTDGGGLSRLRGSSFANYTKKDGLPSETVYALAQDRSGSLWIGTAAGLARLRDGTLTVYTKKDGLSADRVEALVEDRDGSLWVGTYGGGLNRLREGRFTSFTTREGLSNDMVKSLYEDLEGSLWIGTRTGGLNRLKDGRFVSYSVEEGLSNPYVWSVHEGRDGSLWIGTDGGGLNHFRDGRFRAYTTRDGLSHDFVRTVLEGKDGSVWIGTAGGGLNRLRDGRFSVFTTKDGLSHDFVRALYEDREGTLWIGTYGGGLSRFRGGRFGGYTTRDGLAGNIIYCLLETRDGDLWVGTRDGGLSRLHDGRFTSYRKKDGLSDEVVLSLYQDADEVLWIGTSGGINRLKNGRFTSVAKRDGLFDDAAYVILEDGAGRFWMSSNRGVYSASKKELDDFLDGKVKRVSSVSYGKADGLKGPECQGGIFPAAWRTRDGRLWFPTVRGIAVVDPSEARMNRRAPPVAIEQVRVDGRDYDPRVRVQAPPGRGELRFHYAGLSLLAPEKVRFRRKLEGFDADWVDAGDSREAEYTNIPPGSYVFRMTACNEDGVWNEEGAALRLDLTPYFHQTGLFRVLSALAILLAASGAFALRVRRLKARQDELKGLVDERTRDLKQATLSIEQTNTGLQEAVRVKDEVVAIVAHDFRAPLEVIRGHGETLAERAPDAESRRLIGIMNQHARHLATLADDTLTMSRIETGSLPLALQTVRIVDLVRSIVEARAAAPGADVTLEATEDGLVVTGDPDRLYQVVDNLVGNAIKYSPDGARVRASVRRTPEGVQVSVADNGLGISVEDMGRLFQKFSRLEGARHRRISGTGLGLYICRSIVEAHGGRIWAESRPGQGSTFHFVLPPPKEAAA